MEPQKQPQDGKNGAPAHQWPATAAPDTVKIEYLRLGEGVQIFGADGSGFSTRNEHANHSDKMPAEAIQWLPGMAGVVIRRANKPAIVLGWSSIMYVEGAK